MNELSLYPNVYKTGASKGLISILERVWVREQTPGDGTFYIISGFVNYNGGVRFFDTFRKHVDSGGKIVALLGGSTSHTSQGQMLVVTSRNFTDPGMAQNIEMSLLLDRPTTNSLNFS